MFPFISFFKSYEKFLNQLIDGKLYLFRKYMKNKTALKTW